MQVLVNKVPDANEKKNPAACFSHPVPPSLPPSTTNKSFTSYSSLPLLNKHHGEFLRNAWASANLGWQWGPGSGATLAVAVLYPGTHYRIIREVSGCCNNSLPLCSGAVIINVNVFISLKCKMSALESKLNNLYLGLKKKEILFTWEFVNKPLGLAAWLAYIMHTHDGNLHIES